MIKVEKNVPPPPPRTRRNKYPFVEMEVNDCFIEPVAYESAICSASQWGKRHGVKFRTQMTAKGLRVWRIA